MKRLRNSFKKFYGRYPGLSGKFLGSVKGMADDLFPALSHKVMLLALSPFQLISFYCLQCHFFSIFAGYDGCIALRRQWSLNPEHLVCFDRSKFPMKAYCC